jgi:hypothetical protein
MSIGIRLLVGWGFCVDLGIPWTASTSEYYDSVGYIESTLLRLRHYNVSRYPSFSFVVAHRKWIVLTL